MRIFIDIGHPAHVHYFRNFIKLMKAKGHEFFVTARDREPVFSLLEHYGIKYINRGRGGRTVMGKIWYLLGISWRQYRRARKFKPDLFLDFSTMYSGPASKILGKPYVTFTDTENTGIYRQLIKPFSKAVYTPACFNRELGPQHHRFNGLMELAYLHPRYFSPDPSVLDQLGIKEGESFSVVRFVGWDAVHDRGKHGFTNGNKDDLVKLLQREGKVFISSEKPLPSELEHLRLNIEPYQIHDVLFYATLLVGESATMTTEAAILGTPAVFVSGFPLGNLNYLEDQYGVVLNFGTSEKDREMAIQSAVTLMKRPGTKGNAVRQSKKILEDHIDVTQFVMEVVGEYNEAVVSPD